MNKEDEKMLEIIHNNCKKQQELNKIKNKKRKIKVSVLMVLFIILLCLLGLVNSINNDILKVGYAIVMLLLLNSIRKRLSIEVR